MTPLKEIALIFLKLGTFAFGGPAAHIAMMEKEFVEKRQWLSQDEFLTMMGFTNLIPGPNSTEMALHIGYLRGKGKGMLVAGISFILPATLMVLALTSLLIEYGSIPSVYSALLGVGPVMLGLILSVIIKFSKPILKNTTQWFVLIVAFVASFFINELAILLMTGLLFFLLSKRRAYVLEPISLLTLFLIFLKIGSILYGSGYVLLAFIKTEFMDIRQVLTLKEIMDALTIGQLTPGPVFTTATAIGVLLHGWVGGLVATVGIFLPAFLLVYFLHPLFKKLSQNASLKTFLDGLKLASLALMMKVAFDVAWSYRENWLLVLAPISMFLLIKTKINPTFLILGGVIIGWLARFL
ncbi:MAG: chromate transporter [Erysipelotrichaceae bacterium]|nr:MAG: chromate [Erysipelotrichaceae bacterium]TXT19624.1 MAG: chromate transporter [Erysipelotrichaceae bacterium]